MPTSTQVTVYTSKQESKPSSQPAREPENTVSREGDTESGCLDRTDPNLQELSGTHSPITTWGPAPLCYCTDRQSDPWWCGSLPFSPPPKKTHKHTSYMHTHKKEHCTLLSTTIGRRPAARALVKTNWARDKKKKRHKKHTKRNNNERTVVTRQEGHQRAMDGRERSTARLDAAL